jgi:hypothetical protein
MAIRGTISELLLSRIIPWQTLPYSDSLPRVAMLAATVRPSEAGFRESCPMPTKRSRATPSPVRVRHEPPTVAEAVAAAQALTPNLAQQVEITAGLMGLTPDEARPFVLALPPFAWTERVGADV